MKRTYTNEQKFQATKKAIFDFILACGPVEMPEIVAEVKNQAFPAYLPKALSELMQQQRIKFDSEFQCYEMR